jgi:tetratricopeptide (TPR) repeat protein
MVEIDNAMERGKRLRASGDREAAEREFRKILEYAKWMPTGVELETRRRQAEEMLGHVRRPPEAQDEFRVRIEQSQIDITKHVRDGERFLAARMYEEAKREFGAAEFKIRNIPYEVKAMRDLLPLIEEATVKASNAKILDERRVEEEKRRSSVSEAESHDLAVRREVTRKMAHLLELSYMAFEQKRYDRVIRLTDEILLIDPNYAVAREIREDAQKSRHKEEYYGILAKKIENWKRLTDDDEEAIIPSSRTVRFPSRDEWQMISKRITEAVLKTEGGPSGDEDPALLAVQRKLDTMKIDLAFENAKLEDVVARIRDASGLNVVLDAQVRDRVDPDRPVTFKAEGLPVRDALQLLLARQGLGYRVTDENVVLLTDPKLAADRRREIELLFGQAKLHFEREQFARSAEVLDGLLHIDPSQKAAAEMREAARRMNPMKRGRGSLKGHVDGWDREFAAQQARDELVFPDREAWREMISKRKPKGISELEEDVRPEDREILDKLLTARVTVEMRNAPLTAAVDRLREETGLNIHLSGVENPDREVVDLSVKDVPVDGALRALLGPRGKGYEVKDGVVVIAPAEVLRRRVRLELYDVQDVTYGMQDFPGVDLSLATGKVEATVRPKAEPPGRKLPPKELLASFKVDLEARATPLEALQHLADRSGLSFSIDAGAKPRLERAPASDWSFRGVVLERAVDRVLESLELIGSLSSDGTLRIQVRLRVGEELAAQVKAAVFPGSWVEADGKSIQFQNGLLVVRNTAEVHAAVRKYLAELRR